MNRTFKLGLAGLITALAVCSPGLALDVGQRVPRLTLTDCHDKPFTLPSYQRPEPTVVWFTFPWRTPHQLFEKILSVTQANQASLVIIPIFDANNVKRLAPTLNQPGEYVGTTSANNATTGADDATTGADSATTGADDATSADDTEAIVERLLTAPYRGAEDAATPNAQTESGAMLPVDSTTPGTEPSAPVPETTESAKTTHTESSATGSSESAEVTLPISSATVATEPAKATQAELSIGEATDPAVASQQAASKAETSQPDSLAVLQNDYLIRLRQMARIFPKAYFINDKTNAALVAYTQLPITNILPNPNLYIIDTNGYVSWSGFYPGLTVGTLSRAISNARVKKHSKR